MQQAKSFEISKQLVMEAYRKVKANKGAAGADKVSIAQFEENLKDNLYKIWNRMSSGCYMPPPVKLVEIPKSGKGNGTRPLGIPTVSDRVAQMVTVLTIEPFIEPHFHEDSYAYRKNKSALQAIEKARNRSFKFDWVVDLDISKFFDTIDHDLLLKAITKHVTCKWALLYIKRWLTAPYALEDGSLVERTKGVPQGSVIGPVLANLFLHYVFDKWMQLNFPTIPFERYADDIICHCVSLKQAETIKRAIQKRLAECRLKLNETKTKIVHCKKEENRNLNYDCIQYDFLGYTFKPRTAFKKGQGKFLTFSPAISSAAKKKICERVKKWKLGSRVQHKLEEIARDINPILRGWINYYGKYNSWKLMNCLCEVNNKLARWLRNKYKKLKVHKRRSFQRLAAIAVSKPGLFAHWKLGCYPHPQSGNKKDRIIKAV